MELRLHTGHDLSLVLVVFLYLLEQLLLLLELLVHLFLLNFGDAL